MKIFNWLKRADTSQPLCECGLTEHTISVIYYDRRLRYTLPAMRAHDVIAQIEHDPHPFDGITFMDSLDVLHTLYPEHLKSWMINL